MYLGVGLEALERVYLPSVSMLPPAMQKQTSLPGSVAESFHGPGPEFRRYADHAPNASAGEYRAASTACWRVWPGGWTNASQTPQTAATAQSIGEFRRL